MGLENYFIEKLNELNGDMHFNNLIRQADQQDCQQSVNSDITLFQNEGVTRYYNMIIGTVENFEETGVFAHNDNKELANCKW